MSTSNRYVCRILSQISVVQEPGKLYSLYAANRRLSSPPSNSASIVGASSSSSPVVRSASFDQQSTMASAPETRVLIRNKTTTFAYFQRRTPNRAAADSSTIQPPFERKRMLHLHAEQSRRTALKVGESVDSFYQK